MLRFGVVCSALAMLAGCASIQRGDLARSEELKKFERRANVVQLYVCRESRFVGGGVRPTIELDGKPLATIFSGTYAYAEIHPGEHTIVAKTLEHDSVLTFDAAAGQQRFFQTWISPGVIMGWGLIDEINEHKGRACVMDAELVEAPKS